MNKIFNYHLYFKIIGIYFIFFFFVKNLTPRESHGDIEQFRTWACCSLDHGLASVYEANNTPHHLPFYQYILSTYGNLEGSYDNIQKDIPFLKSLTLFFTIGSSLILFGMIFKKSGNIYKSIVFSLFYLLNFAVIYNSIIWGQIDEIYSFFIFSSVISGFYKKHLLSILAFILALNSGIQALLFIPLILFINKDLFNDKIGLIKSVGSAIILQIIVLYPFKVHLSKIINLYIHSFIHYPKVSMNAYNFWYFFLKGNLYDIPDSNTFMGLSYQTIGAILFIITLIPIGILLLKKNKESTLQLNKVLIIGALVPVLCFFFNTEMHERYSHSMLIFLAAYALLYNRYIPYILGSIAHFLNLEDVLQYYQFDNYNALYFKAWFIATLFLIVIILLFLDLFDINIYPKNKLQENIEKLA